MHYMPVLRDKTAEMKSLTLLGQPTQIEVENLWPLVEVREPQTEESVKNTLLSISNSLASSVVKRFLVDLYNIESNFPSLTIEDGSTNYSPIDFLSASASSSHWLFTPVVAINSSNSTLTSASRAHATHQQGVAIRLDFEDFDLDDFDSQINQLLDSLSIPISEVHIIFDIGFISAENISRDKKAVLGTLALLPRRKEWASITIVGAAYPSRNPSNLSVGSITSIPRSEWALFNQLFKLHEDLNYGDYGIENIEESTPLKGPFASGNLRYTTDSSWLFVKGKPITKGGHDYMATVYSKAAGMPQFKGAAYSWGDNYIYQAANSNGGPGSPTTWRQIAITHHITFTLEQIRGLASAGPATQP